MDLKCDDTFELDPALLLGYEFQKLNLDSINDILSNGILDIPESEDNAEAENDVSSGDKVTETVDSKGSEDDGVTSSTTVDKSDAVIGKVETSRITKRKKDINGNEEPLSDENLNELFVKLELSDSDNEEADDEDSSKLKERGPIRPRRRANRIKDQNTVWGRNDGYDTSQFNSERLRFLSGSNQILSHEPTIPNEFPIDNNLTTILTGNEPVCTLSNQDLFYEDARAHSVSSPESGYDSSAQSITGSPPPPAVSFCTSLSLDFIPETVDDQNIFEFLIENSDGALPDNLSLYNTDEKDEICEINKIVNFLKEDIPSELSEASNVITLSDNNTVDYVPLVDHSEDLNTKSVSISQVSSNTASKCVETPKKLVYKLKDEAKKALREFLSNDEFYEVKKRIYKKIHEDKKNKKKIKVICVEDEMDKGSENRTNLHLAVLNNKIEDIYCLVEIHKQYNQPLTDINIRDKHGKTALDYAIQNQMTLVIDYLKENTACQSVNI